MTGPPVEVASIESLVDRYAYFLFDQFGVLHDGTQALPGRRSTLERLRAAGARVGVITNSGKRAAYNRERLAGFGFDDAVVDTVVSSGEIAWALLSDAEVQRARGAVSEAIRVFVIARGDDRGFLEGLPVVPVDDTARCDLVLIAGAEPERVALECYRAWLLPAARRDVPALCTNPDHVMLLGDGRTGYSAGRIADLYAELGGTVRWIGKPWPEIYTHALALGEAAPRDTLCIGDSVEHDIGGAVAAGCDSLLVRTGIHAGATPAELDALFATTGHRPTWIEAA